MVLYDTTLFRCCTYIAVRLNSCSCLWCHRRLVIQLVKTY